MSCFLAVPRRLSGQAEEVDEEAVTTLGDILAAA
jgi:hypothetical protein